MESETAAVWVWQLVKVSAVCNNYGSNKCLQCSLFAWVFFCYACQQEQISLSLSRSPQRTLGNAVIWPLCLWTWELLAGLQAQAELSTPATTEQVDLQGK